MKIRYIIPTVIVTVGRSISRDQAFAKSKHSTMSRDVPVTIGIM